MYIVKYYTGKRESQRCFDTQREAHAFADRAELMYGYDILEIADIDDDEVNK